MIKKLKFSFFPENFKKWEFENLKFPYRCKNSLTSLTQSPELENCTQNKLKR